MSGFDLGNLPDSLGENADFSKITPADAQKAFIHLDDKQVAEIVDQIDKLYQDLLDDREYLEGMLALVAGAAKIVVKLI